MSATSNPDTNLQGHSRYVPGLTVPHEQGDSPTLNRTIQERESHPRPHISAERAQESQPVEQGGGGRGDVQYGPNGVDEG